MRKIPPKCPHCKQSLDEDLFTGKFSNHIDIYECLSSLIKRVEDLENELLAKKLPDGLSRSSEPGPPSSDPGPVVIPEYPKGNKF